MTANDFEPIATRKDLVVQVGPFQEKSFAYRSPIARLSLALTRRDQGKTAGFVFA